LHGDFDSAPALELIERDRVSWIEYFLELGREKTTWPAEDAGVEMHDLSLLRALFKSAGGKMDVFQNKFDRRQSANKNLAGFSHLLDLRPMEWASFDSFDERRMREALLRSKILEGNELDVVGLKRIIVQYVPIGFPDAVYETLPAHLVHDIGYGTVEGFRILM
jgi:hypothetical protein